YAASVDHVGLFTQDVAGMRLVAPLLCAGWRAEPEGTASLPILGVPDGPYLAQASPEGLAALEAQLARLARAGYAVRRVPAPGDAPAGLDSTGVPALNLPWTHAGLPAITLPAGRVAGLPVGLQGVARATADERLLAWAGPLADALRDA